MQIDLYLAFEETNVPPGKKAAFAITYLRDRAQRWVAPFWKQHTDDEEDDVDWIDNFNRFKREIRKVFGESNEDSKAIRIIQNITQKKSAAEYSAQFKQYAVETG